MKLNVLLSLILWFVSCVQAKYGSHDLFTSLAQLRQLWADDRDFVRALESALPALESLLDASKKYIFKWKCPESFHFGFEFPGTLLITNV